MNQNSHLKVGDVVVESDGEQYEITAVQSDLSDASLTFFYSAIAIVFCAAFFALARISPFAAVVGALAGTGLLSDFIVKILVEPPSRTAAIEMVKVPEKSAPSGQSVLDFDDFLNA
jgi:hypothetical protein